MPDRVRDVMSTDLVTISATATVREAAEKMKEHNIGNVLVADDGGRQGILTDRDLVVRGVAAGCSGDDPAAPYASYDLFTVGPDDAVASVVATMAQKKVRRVPVVEGGEFVGILSLGDLAENRDPDSVLGEISDAPPNN